MNKLNEMGIAELTESEVDQLSKFEDEMNKLHNKEEIYLLALKK